MKGTGDKAFSAGGDIRILSSGIANSTLDIYDFFRDSYTTFYMTSIYKIPYISFWNGIVMGGGAGLSIYGSHRIATEKTVFGMPENAIGLFPDVGASYFLNKLPGKLGLFMGLTGYRLNGKDVLATGYATHYTDSHNLPKIEKDLLNLTNVNGINSVLEKYCFILDDNFSSLDKYLDQINELFTGKTMEEIFKNLENDKSEFAQSTLTVSFF